MNIFNSISPRFIFYNFAPRTRGSIRDNLPIIKTVATNRAMLVASKLIKGGIKKTIREIRDGIIPSVFIWQLPIKYSRIPLSVRGPHNFRKGVPFSISVGPNLGIRKTLSEGEEMDIIINTLDALFPSNLK